MMAGEDNIIHLSSVRREKRPASCDPVIEALKSHAATMRQAALPLQHSLAHLEKDPRPQRSAFWQRQLRTLAALQEEVQPCIDLLCDDPAALPYALRIARYGLLHPLFLARAEMEKITISITAYLPLCQSPSEKSLRLRRNIVRGMRELLSNVEEATRLLETVHISQEED